MRMIHLLAVWACWTAASSVSNAGMIIDTTSTWNGSSSISPFAEPGIATFGQTFTAVGPNTSLDSFTFWLNDYNGVDYPGVVKFDAYVMAWDQTNLRATGPILYQSSTQTPTNNGGIGGMERFDFSTGGLSVVDGQMYVAFLSMSNYFDGIWSGGALGSLGANVYSGGYLVYLNNGGDASTFTTGNWGGSGFAMNDLAFRAEFSVPSAVPEPASMAIFCFGSLGMLFGAARRRRQQQSLAA